MEFGKAIEIDPACAEAYLGTATAYEGQDNYTNAAEMLEVGYEKTGENPNVKDRMTQDYLYLAENYIEEGEYEEGLEIFDRLMELDGENQQVFVEKMEGGRYIYFPEENSSMTGTGAGIYMGHGWWLDLWTEL